MTTKKLFQVMMAASVVLVALVSGPLMPLSAQEGEQMGEDPFNLIYKVEKTDDGLWSSAEVSAIPSEAFSQETFAPEPKEDEFTPGEPERVHKVLAQMVAQDPSMVAPVIILLDNDLQMPRFPDLAFGVSRESPEGQQLAEEVQGMIEGLFEMRRRSTEEFLSIAAGLGVSLEVEEQFWLVNGFLTEIELGQVESLLNAPQLTYIQPRYAGEPPPQDGNANNDVQDGRFRTVTDPYYGLNLTQGYIGLLDTGIRQTHVLFNNPSNVDYVLDCVNGGSKCNNTKAKNWNPSDDCWNHGTSTAAILVGNNRLGDAYRGVTAVTLDSWKIYPNGCKNLDTAAALRGFQQAISVFDRLIVAEIQSSETENGSLALAADNAFDVGVVVVAANGNFGPGSRSVASPGLAHKAIGVGAYDVQTQAVPSNQGRGPAVDGRIKPDLQAPTDTETASSLGDSALTHIDGTSGSTPYAAGAAALQQNWLRSYNTKDAGYVYVRMMNSGTVGYPKFNNTIGLGQLRMPTSGNAWWGKVSVSQGSAIHVPIKINANDQNLRVSLWWPESQKEVHDDVDLSLLDPLGREMAKSRSALSIFERATIPSYMMIPGTWTVRIEGYKIKSGPQTVYWTVDVRN